MKLISSGLGNVRYISSVAEDMYFRTYSGEKTGSFLRYGKSPKLLKRSRNFQTDVARLEAVL